MCDYPCTGSAVRKFDEGELGGGVIINWRSTNIASSSKVIKLVRKFVGGVGWIISVGGVAVVSDAGTIWWNHSL